eukprot:1153863-Pelagomonas_calceolata.AAC.3
MNAEYRLDEPCGLQLGNTWRQHTDRMETPAILSPRQSACILQKRCKNGIKSRGRGGIDMRNVAKFSLADTRLEDGKAGNEGKQTVCGCGQ